LKCDSERSAPIRTATPLPLQTAHAAEVKTQESETFSFCQVNESTLVFIDIDLEFGQFLS